MFSLGCLGLRAANVTMLMGSSYSSMKSRSSSMSSVRGAQRGGRGLEGRHWALGYGKRVVAAAAAAAMVVGGLAGWGVLGEEWHRGASPPPLAKRPKQAGRRMCRNDLRWRGRCGGGRHLALRIQPWSCCAATRGESGRERWLRSVLGRRIYVPLCRFFGFDAFEQTLPNNGLVLMLMGLFLIKRMVAGSARGHQPAHA